MFITPLLVVYVFLILFGLWGCFSTGLTGTGGQFSTGLHEAFSCPDARCWSFGAVFGLKKDVSEPEFHSCFVYGFGREV